MDQTYTADQVALIAKKLLTELVATDSATIVGLSGDLGAGKTALVQALAHELGVTDQVASPTFVIAKFYETADDRFTHLVHIDAYRIEDVKELAVLGWESIKEHPRTLVIIEWPERIEELLGSTAVRFHIEHQGDARHIKRV